MKERVALSIYLLLPLMRRLGLFSHVIVHFTSHLITLFTSHRYVEDGPILEDI